VAREAIIEQPPDGGTIRVYRVKSNREAIREAERELSQRRRSPLANTYELNRAEEYLRLSKEAFDLWETPPTGVKDRVTRSQSTGRFADVDAIVMMRILKVVGFDQWLNAVTIPQKTAVRNRKLSK
jgi:hypothetical protein